MELSFKKFYEIEEEHDKVAVYGKLKCHCGSEHFSIFHTGKQTRGILSPFIKKQQKQIMFEAKCKKCGQTIQIYDNTLDGEKPVIASHPEKTQFIYKNTDHFKVKIILNYYEENYMTNKFVTIYIYLYDESNKQIVLYEE